MKFEINIVHEGRNLKMPIDAHIRHNTWEISSGGLLLASVSKKKIYYRDKMISQVESYMQQLWDYNIIEKMKDTNHYPPKNRDLGKMPKDEQWFYSITVRNTEAHKHKSFPVWTSPSWPPNPIDGRADFASTGATPTNMYKVLKDFMKTPLVRERMKRAETSNKFGL